jgi:lauroyl/myristoyl acyltransferase
MSEPEPDAQRDVPMVAMTPATVAALDRLIQQARTRRRVPMLVTNENGALEMADVIIEKLLAKLAVE